MRLEDRERLAGTAGRSQRPHQQGGQRLVQRMRGDERLQLGDHVMAGARSARPGRPPGGRAARAPAGPPRRAPRPGSPSGPRQSARAPAGSRSASPGEPVGVDPVSVDRPGDSRSARPRSTRPARRSRDTSACSALAAAAGGSSPQTPSISRSAETTRLASRASRISRVRRRAPATGTVSPVPVRSSTGPSTAMSTGQILPRRGGSRVPPGSYRRVLQGPPGHRCALVVRSVRFGP